MMFDFEIETREDDSNDVVVINPVVVEAEDLACAYIKAIKLCRSDFPFMTQYAVYKPRPN